MYLALFLGRWDGNAFLFSECQFSRYTTQYSPRLAMMSLGRCERSEVEYSMRHLNQRVLASFYFEACVTTIAYYYAG